MIAPMSSPELPECGVARFLMLCNGPWATLIVRELLHGPQRFGELREGLTGISAHTLTNRLRMFEERGIVTRTSYPEIPPRVVYELTDLGHQLRPVLDAMNAWGVAAPVSAFAPVQAPAPARAPAQAQTPVQAQTPAQAPALPPVENRVDAP